VTVVLGGKEVQKLDSDSDWSGYTFQIVKLFKRYEKNWLDVLASN